MKSKVSLLNSHKMAHVKKNCSFYIKHFFCYGAYLTEFQEK